MPALKSIFAKDITEGNERFKEFLKNFENYKQALAKLPGMYAVVNKTVEEIAQVTQEIADSEEKKTGQLEEQKKLHEDSAEAVQEEGEAAEEGAKTQERITRELRIQLDVYHRRVASARQTEQSAKSTYEWTKYTAIAWNSIKSDASSIFNLGKGVLSFLNPFNSPWAFTKGLLGVGGTLFGMDLLGNSASRGLRSSVGMGTGYGEQNALGLTYNRVADASSLLNSVANAKASIGGAEWSALTVMGVDMRGDNSQVSKRALDRARGLAKSTPEELWQSMLVEGFGLGNLGIGSQDLRRFKNMSDPEWERYSKQFGTRSDQIGINEATLRKWQDFVNTLDVTGKRIESSLIRGLVSAAGPLEKLSDAAASVIEKFIGSKSFEWVIGKITTGLSTFADYISSPKFATDMQALWDGLASMGAFLNRLFGTSTPTSSPQPVITFEQYRKQHFDHWLHKGKEGDPTQERIVRDNYKEYLRQQGHTQGSGMANQSILVPSSASAAPGSLLDTIARLETGGHPNPDRAISSAGAIGRYQIMPGTAAGYGVSRDQLFDPATNKATAEKLLADLSARYKGNTAAILAAYNAGPQIGDYIMNKPGHLPMLRPSDNQPWDYQQTQGYLAKAGIKVVIDNPAGADVATQVNQLGGTYPAVPGVVPR